MGITAKYIPANVDLSFEEMQVRTSQRFLSIQSCREVSVNSGDSRPPSSGIWEAVLP